jgi:hypothetical protein
MTEDGVFNAKEEHNVVMDEIQLLRMEGKFASEK